MWISLS